MKHANDVNSIIQRMPAIVARGGTAEDYTEAHAEEFLELMERRAEVTSAHQIDNATGVELDRIGALFGQLGDRQSRSDGDYRSYLKSIIDSFNARGSLSGVKFAVAGAIGEDTENVRIIEDFETLSYSIQIINVETRLITTAVNDLAELADPSVVELDEAIILVDSGGVNVGAADSTVTDEGDGLGSGTLSLDGSQEVQ